MFVTIKSSGPDVLSTSKFPVHFRFANRALSSRTERGPRARPAPRAAACAAAHPRAGQRVGVARSRTRQFHDRTQELPGNVDMGGATAVHCTVARAAWAVPFVPTGSTANIVIDERVRALASSLRGQGPSTNRDPIATCHKHGSGDSE
eukprot:4822410-Prymnesium_polylepis.1